MMHNSKVLGICIGLSPCNIIPTQQFDCLTDGQLRAIQAALGYFESFTIEIQSLPF
jgi:hypothetical protein